MHDDHEAEDASQATFLVLFQKASSIKRHQAVASWLHQIGYRTALRARSRTARLLLQQDSMLSSLETSATTSADAADTVAVLDEEMLRLLEKCET